MIREVQDGTTILFVFRPDLNGVLELSHVLPCDLRQESCQDVAETIESVMLEGESLVLYDPTTRRRWDITGKPAKVQPVREGREIATPTGPNR